MKKITSFYQQRFPALGYKDFNIMWLGITLSAVGTQMQIVATNWQVYILTNSAVALGIIGLLRFLSIAAFAIPGGLTADKFNRKRILFITQLISSILAFVLAITTFNHSITITLIYIVTVLASITLAFDTPARQAISPQLVKKEHFPNAASINFIGWQTAVVVGPAIGGFLIGQYGVGLIYLLNGISFFAVLIGLLLISFSGEIQGEKQEFSFKAVKHALDYIVHRKIIWSTMLLDFFSTFFASATALLPIYAKDILVVGPQGLGLLFAAPSVGAVIAGVTLAHFHNLKRQGLILLTGVFSYGVGTILFGLSRNFILSLFFLAIVGAGDSISTIIRNTIRQLETPDSIRGRMVAINMIFFMGGPQLGEFEAGILASGVGAPLSVALGGIGTLLAVLGMGYLIPTLRNYDSHKTT